MVKNIFLVFNIDPPPLKMTLKESKNVEGKGNNVIMYNFPEPNIKNKDERMETELETINNF